MPKISEFHGVSIYMYWSEHGLPHFHARYAEHQAVVDIRGPTVLAGSLPRPQLKLVLDWAGKRTDELLRNWEKARRGESLDWVVP